MLFSRSKIRILPLCFVLAMLLPACQGNTPVTDVVEPDSVPEPEFSDPDSLLLYDDEPEPESADMLFADFFYAFTTDNHYQQQRIQFPLRCKNEGGEAVTLAHWNELHAFQPQEFYAVIYDNEADMAIQSDTTVREVHVERIQLDAQTMSHYHFERVQGKWLLVDYEEEEVSQTPNSSFLEFYGNFVADTLFQRESILFPLVLKTETEEGDEDGQAELTEEEWPEFRDQMPLPSGMMTAIDYGQAALSQNRKVLLMEGMSNGLFVKYKFDRTNDQWKLYEIDF